MHSIAVSYFKRYKMEIALASLPVPVWPREFSPVAWRPDLLETHADVLAQCFAGEIDSVVFPSLGNRGGCNGLMTEIVHRRAFIPEATWMVVGPDGPCGTVQVLRERQSLAAIQNVGIVPRWRGRGLGEALVLECLRGLAAVGVRRAVLEVTAHNEAAIRLYTRLGFRRTKVLYKAIPSLVAPQGAEGCF